MTRFAIAAAMALAMLASAGAEAGTLETVRKLGQLRCVVNAGVAGFAYVDPSGTWRGFDADFCRATAAAVLGDPSKVKFLPSTGKTRFSLLNSGEGDVLWRNTTWTFVRDVDVKLSFQGVNYYDGQGFMVPKSLGVKSAKELDGASVCIQTGTTTELNLSDFFRIHKIRYEPVPIETNEEVRASYLAGRCDVYTTDISGLAATRSTFTDPKAHIILPEVISKEPLGPATRHGDDRWGDIVRWVLNATIAAEELGITQGNVDQLSRGAIDPEINRMLGSAGDLGAMLGLDKRWVVDVIAAVGNYGEIFERNIGRRTPIGLERGLNALWREGGLLYSPPFR
ncbi:MAG: amino acid ABC transporter substrate-binding protein [Hyphomicrobiales bacterium]|nr:amino acid ABC transporter substrate-binding protein [Hyphomicrobiales bacterium]